MKMHIRYYRSSDYDMLIGLLGKVYGSNIDQKTLEKAYLSNARSILVAVTEDEVLVGCTFTEVQDDYIRPSRIMFVTYVAVDETFRKHGIGRMLFAKVEDECKKKRCTAIELTSADFRTDAHAFYNKLGFTKKKTTLFIKEL